MDPGALIVYAGALAVAAGSPGPSTAALSARVLTHGVRDAAPFMAAMWIGEALWLTLAVFGLAVVAQELHWAFAALKWAGVAYLAWLAWKQWTAPVVLDAADLRRPRGRPLRLFLAGMAVTLGNPKIMLFYLALLPAIIDLRTVTLGGWVELVATMLIVLAAVDLAWAALAGQARRLVRSPRGMRLANRCSATVMGGAALAIASRADG